jgi:hypothetical protein
LLTLVNSTTLFSFASACAASMEMVAMLRRAGRVAAEAATTAACAIAVRARSMAARGRRRH